MHMSSKTSQQQQEGDRFRYTVFCSNNPIKEVNPVKHIEKRSVDKIIQSLSQNKCIKQAQNSHICYKNQETFNYNNKENHNLENIQSQRHGKKFFDNIISQNQNKNFIVNPPIQNRERIHSRKGSGQFNQGYNKENHLRTSFNPISSRTSLPQKQGNKKMFNNATINKETITTELTNNINLYYKYEKQEISQRKHMPGRRTTLQDCFNDFPERQAVKITGSHENTQIYNPVQDYNISQQRQIRSTTQDMLNCGQIYNRPQTQKQPQNQLRNSNVIFKHATSSRTHQPYYL